MPKSTAGRLLFALLVFALLSLIARNVHHRLQAQTPAASSLAVGRVFTDTPLFQAAARGNLDEVKTLLAHGADVNASGANGSPLRAALHGRYEPGKRLVVSVEVVRTLLAHHADPNRVHGNLDTEVPLALAIEHQPQVVEDLLTAGADVNAGHGQPLRAALQAHRLDVAEELLRHGAQVNPAQVQDRQALRLSPLTLALWYAPEYVTRLRQAGAQMPEEEKQTILSYVLTQAQQTKDLPHVLARLRSCGADVNGKPLGTPPLITAIANAPSSVAWLLEQGATPNPVGSHSLTPLYAATQAGQAETVRLLLAHGADPNGQAPNGQSALFYARKHNKAEIVALLQQAGAKE